MCACKQISTLRSMLDYRQIKSTVILPLTFIVFFDRKMANKQLPSWHRVTFSLLTDVEGDRIILKQLKHEGHSAHEPFLTGYISPFGISTNHKN